MSNKKNAQLMLYEIDSHSKKDFDDINIILNKKSWKKFEENLFKKAGF